MVIITLCGFVLCIYSCITAICCIFCGLDNRMKRVSSVESTQTQTDPTPILSVVVVIEHPNSVNL
jgi:hypothetical protein